MPANRFCRYQLLTTAVDDARAFYAEVLGPQFWGSDVSVAPLPAAAIARGAPAHWVGFLGVSDVEGIAGRLVAAGGQPMGPLQRDADGVRRAVLRDPFGAKVGVCSGTEAPRAEVVAWRLLHVQDHEQAFALYASLFGWTPTDALDLGPERGRHQMFAWDESGKTAGSIANTARLPHIHTHWMHFFRVADLEGALVKVRALGGLVVGTMQTPSGDDVAPCDDAQGAAFGLYQAARR